MTASNLFMFFIVVFITSVTPGAGVLYTLRNAVTYGKDKAYLSPTGNAIGVLFMSIVAASGLGAIIHSSPKLFLGLQLAGCALMIYFGWKSWKAPAIALNTGIKHMDPGSKKKEGLKILTSAALLQLTNPMLIVFLLSLMPQFVNDKIPYVSQLAILIGIFVVTCWCVHIVYSYSAAFAASKWMNARFSLILNKVSAVLFWLLSISVAVKLLN